MEIYANKGYQLTQVERVKTNSRPGSAAACSPARLAFAESVGLTDSAGALPSLRYRAKRPNFAMLAMLAIMVLFLALMTTALSGCKYSDVLTEHIEDPENGILDETQDPIYKQNPDADEDSDVVSLVIDDSDRIDEQLQDLPQFDSQMTSPNSTKQRQHSDNTTEDSNATQGTEVSSEQGQNSDTGDSESTTDSKAGTSDGEGEGTSDEPEDVPDPGFTDGIAAGGLGGTGTVYDLSGENATIPDLGSLAATGQYATIVQMLAGKGGLRAADSEWKAMVAAKGIFPDADEDGVADVVPAWSGAADSESGYTLDVDMLIEAAPDGVIVDSDHFLLNDSDRARLQDAKIDVLEGLPSLGKPDTSDEEVVKAVQIVGQMLSKADTRKDTSIQVNNYIMFHDDAVDKILSLNGGYSYKTISGTSFVGIYQGESDNGKDTAQISDDRVTTAFIDSVTHALNTAPIADRTFAGTTLDDLDGQRVDANQGVGLSVAGKSKRFLLMDYYLQMAGVVDNSFDAAKPTYSESGSAQSAIILPGFANDLIPSALTGTFITRLYASSLWYEDNVGWLAAGDGDFPGVLARTDEIASSIAENAASSDGIYHTPHSYFVRVVPTGIAGSWADGTVESYLLAPWAWGAFRMDGDVRGNCDTFVSNFYSTFYRTDDYASVIDCYDKSY